MLENISRNNGQDYLVWRPGSGGTAEIFDIAVNTERQKGVGRDMVEELKRTTSASRIFAITRASNSGACRFYKKIGFKLCANLPKFYEDEDAEMYLLCR